MLRVTHVDDVARHRQTTFGGRSQRLSDGDVQETVHYSVVHRER